MGKGRLAERGPEAGGGLCGKVLSGDGTKKAEQSHKQHDAAHFPDVGGVPVSNTDVNHLSHKQRDNQFKAGFQKFKERSDDAFLFVSF